MELWRSPGFGLDAGSKWAFEGIMALVRTSLLTAIDPAWVINAALITPAYVGGLRHRSEAPHLSEEPGGCHRKVL